MNSLLSKQIQKYLGGIEHVPNDLIPFLDAISKSYETHNNGQYQEDDPSKINIGEQYSSKQKLSFISSVINSIPDAIIVAEKSGEIIFYNNAAERRHNVKEEGLFGKNIWEIEKITSNLSNKEDNFNGSHTKEGINTKSDGTKVPVEVSIKHFKIEEKEYILTISKEVTEKKKIKGEKDKLIEHLKKTNDELKDFAYVVSHDLKAPLRGISSVSDWLANDYRALLDETGKEYIDILKSRVLRMHNLIEGILNYSKVDKAKDTKTQVNFNLLIEEVLKTFDYKENLSVNVLNEMPTLLVDETQIRQVFQNLISNAIKYNDKPNCKINISAKKIGAHWQFCIEDNGPGIDESYHEKIFQLFQTLQTKDKFESTGLGLSIVMKVVKLYNGNVWIESKLQKGSKFFFTLQE